MLFQKLMGKGPTSMISPSAPKGLWSWGSYRTFAIKTDSTLWAWGDNASNNYGTLGLGDIVNRSSPVQVGTLATWSLLGVASGAAFAVKIDRTLWGWGSNNNGRLGLGDVVFRSSPVQVGTLASWIKIEGGNNQSLGIHVSVDGNGVRNGRNGVRYHFRYDRKLWRIRSST